MPKRRAATSERAKKSCDWKRKATEIIVIDSDSEQAVTDGSSDDVMRFKPDYLSSGVVLDSGHGSSSSVARQNSDSSDDSWASTREKTSTLDSGIPTNHSDKAQQGSDESEDELPSLASLMYGKQTEEKPDTLDSEIPTNHNDKAQQGSDESEDELPSLASLMYGKQTEEKPDTLDSAIPTNHNDKAQQGSDESEDELPSLASLMYGKQTEEKPVQQPKDMPTGLVFPQVSPECIGLGKSVIVYSNSNGIYNAMLTQVCLKKNMNKFFEMQLLQDQQNCVYYVWFRWGRVGEKGARSLIPCGNDNVKAQLLFETKFYQKTKNEWCKHRNFVKYNGKYDMIKIDYTKAESESGNIEKRISDLAKDTIKSKLEPSVKDVMALISNVKEMEENLIDMKFDVIKMPLGKLKREQIREGYKALCKIEECINKHSSEEELMDACSKFYTCIPHSFRRSTRPDVIKEHHEVQMKMRLLEALEDIETAMALLKKDMQDSCLHRLDRFYSSLGCELTKIEDTDSDYHLISKSIRNVHGITHTGYRIVVVNVFRVHKSSLEFSSVGNHRMLWHGSRASNFAGILSEGLRIAPPEVPSNGYMFGKGIYFADCVSKSANYCITNDNIHEGLLLLCEVSLGDIEEHKHSLASGAKLSPGKHSIKGLGHFSPDPCGDHVMKNGATLSCGQLVKDSSVKSSLYYNEYIVYDTKQVKMTYLVRVSLGDIEEHKHSLASGAKLSPGKHSIKGLGHFSPDPCGDHVMKNGATLSCGQLVKDSSVKSSLYYNEYIVYDTKQVKMTYLVRVKFDRLGARFH